MSGDSPETATSDLLILHPHRARLCALWSFMGRHPHFQPNPRGRMPGPPLMPHSACARWMRLMDASNGCERSAHSTPRHARAQGAWRGSEAGTSYLGSISRGRQMGRVALVLVVCIQPPTFVSECCSQTTTSQLVATTFSRINLKLRSLSPDNLNIGIIIVRDSPLITR